MTPACRLPSDAIAMIAAGVSVIVGSRDAAMRPSLMRAVGSQVDPASQRITVYLARAQSRQLLQDLAATGQIAVVFSQPSTHRTVQVKASQVDVRPAAEADRAILAAYLRAMEWEIEQVGFGPPVTRAMLAHRQEDVVAVSFLPEQAFDQTPGPRAGATLGSGG